MHRLLTCQIATKENVNENWLQTGIRQSQGRGWAAHRPLQRLVLWFGGSWNVCALFLGVLGTSSVVGMEKGD